MSMLTPVQRYRIVAQSPDPRQGALLAFPRWLRAGEPVRALFSRHGFLNASQEGPRRKV